MATGLRAGRVYHAWDDVRVVLTFRQATVLAHILLMEHAPTPLRTLAAEFLAACSEDALVASGPADGNAVLLWEELEMKYASVTTQNS